MTRRFSPPRSIKDNGECFIVKDSGGQKLAYVYYEEEAGPTLIGQASDQG